MRRVGTGTRRAPGRIVALAVAAAIAVGGAFVPGAATAAGAVSAAPLPAAVESVPTVANAENTAAAVGSQFDPGLIISDQYFYDRFAMSEAQIAAFLNTQIGSCQNALCLNVVRTNTTSRAADAMCGSYTGAAAETTASIIYKVQTACGISARVLLVTLQKEQGLVTNRAPTASRLDRAMGYACPDNPAMPGWCDPAYAGLYNQIYRSAWQFKRYGNPPGTTNSFTWYPVGAVSAVRYHPNAACPSTNVRIRNAATAALYYYTPYQPNAAALANLYGTGDACSSYGNRNFWRMYSDWFGSPTAPVGTPEGELASTTSGIGTLRLQGWAVDPDAPAGAVTISIQAGSQWFVATADREGADLTPRYPGAGTRHYFDTTIAVPAGDLTVCIYLGNVGAGQTGSLGCAPVKVLDTSPRGEIRDAWTTFDGIALWGWAADPDDLDAHLDLRVVVDGTRTQRWVADQPWDPVRDLMPGAGNDHGWGSTFEVGPGVHTICVYAVNVGAGADTNLGCRTLEVPDGSPKAEMKDVWGTAAGISLWGWAIDTDRLADAATISIRVGSNWYAWKADQNYPIAASYVPGAGQNHGWGGTIPVPAGNHTVCVWVGNQGRGVDVALGCRTVFVPDSSPKGAVADAWGVSGGVAMWGWAIDPDVLDTPVRLSVQVGSSWYVWMADQPYAPAAAFVPGAGQNHGWGATAPAPPGTHNVCVYAVNQGAGSDVSLGCRRVTVPSASPVGQVSWAGGVPGGVQAWGWLIDPDALDQPVSFSVQVDSQWYLWKADLPYEPAASYVAGAGPNHGWGGTIPAAPGRHTICFYPININQGANTSLGCYSVVVPTS